MAEITLGAEELRGADDGREPEADAIDSCLRGEAQGLAWLYERYKIPVFRTCLRILSERSAAEDATQEIFVRVFERLTTFNGASSFSTWLYRLAVNHCLNELDRMKRRTTVPVEEVHDLSDPAGAPEEAYGLLQRREQLLRLLTMLSVEHRTILVLREIEELSYREIADILGVPPGTVMSRLSRAREALKQLWRARDRGPEFRRALE